MYYEVTDKCITCNTCTAFCPAGAIGRGKVRFEIDQKLCHHCGLCAQKCPAMAIIQSKEQA